MDEGALQLFLFCGIHAVVFVLLVTVQPFANRCAHSPLNHGRIRSRVNVHTQIDSNNFAWKPTFVTQKDLERVDGKRQCCRLTDSMLKILFT